MQKNLINPHFPQTHGKPSVGVTEFAAGNFKIRQHVFAVVILFTKGIQYQRYNTFPAFRTMIETLAFQNNRIRRKNLDDIVQGIGNDSSDIFRPRP